MKIWSTVQRRKLPWIIGAVLATGAILLSVIFIKACRTVSVEPQVLFDQAKSQNKTYDAIIVPGYPAENGQWTTLMKIRVYWSWYLYKRGLTKNIVYSGSAVYSPYVESEVMAEYGKALGIPEQNIFTESRAEYSVENLYYSYIKAKDMGMDKIALATDPIQSSKLKGYIEKFGFEDMDIVPIVYDTLMALQMPDVEVDTHAAFVKNFKSIKEKDSLLERWRGATGKRVLKMLRERKKRQKSSNE